MIGLDSAGLVQLTQRFVLPSQTIKNAGAVVVGVYALFRVQTCRQSKTTKRLLVFSLEPIQSGGYPVNGSVVWRFSQQHFNLGARFQFLTARQVNEDHVEPRFKKL